MSRQMSHFTALFSSPLTKQLTTAAQPRDIPLVICLTDVSAYQRDILSSLRSSIQQSTAYYRNVIAIGTYLDKNSGPSHSDGDILSYLGLNPIRRAISIVPVNSNVQRMLVTRDEKLESSTRYKSANIRALQKAIRDRCKEETSIALLQPLAKWKFLDNSDAAKILGAGNLSIEDIDELVRQIGEEFSSETIEKVVLRMGQRQVLLRTWISGEGDGQDLGLGGKWSNFSLETQEAIRKLELEIEFEREINLDENNDANARPAHGVLKHSRIGGALLYGPPGTGKTHLARVIARESKAVTICISAAELESMWVGETEKAIQSLFRLGRLLTPSILFIDEADALFRARGPGDRGYERSRTNQLLAEMDGLARSKAAPFVLLVSNFPHDIDNAVLRRVPSRLHLGLPTTALRRKILGITLRDERLHSDINLEHLADRTYRYSGSDIQALCVQAALVCNSFSTEGEGEGKRILAHSHFEKAFKRVSPTVSGKALMLIQEFAKESDPVGHEKLLALEQQEQEIRARALTYQCDSLDPDGNQIRVLSFDVQKLDGPQNDQDILSCTVEIVSLNDWTLQYVEFKSFFDNVWDTQKNSLDQDSEEGCHHEQIQVNYLREAWAEFGGQKRPHMSPVDDPDDVSGEDIKAAGNRFNWGDYMALSYVWGDPTVKKRIFINKHPFEVTLNLYHALIRLRSSLEVKDRRLKVWIDAICINQNDLSERSSMVRKMDTIYSEALCVRGWVGRPSPAVAAMLPEVQRLLGGKLRDWTPVMQLADDDFELEDERPYALDLDTATSVWLAARSLSSEPYWGRLWITQEMTLASTILFWYGDSVFSPAKVTKLFILPQFSRASVPEDMKMLNTAERSMGILHRIVMLRPGIRSVPLGAEMFVPRAMLPLWDLIVLSQSSKATDQRDKVYGLLALLPQAISSRIRPTYEVSVDAVAIYTLFSSVCIQVDGNLNTLARIHAHTSHSKGLPSWAFDLEAAPDGLWDDDLAPHLKDLPLRYQSAGHLATASRGSLEDLLEQSSADGGQKPSIAFSADLRLLTCRGLFIDTVSGLGAGHLHFVTFKHISGPEQCVIHPANELSSSSGKDVSRLSIARLLMHDRKYEFCQGPSVLDIPWMSFEKVGPEYWLSQDPTPLTTLRAAFEGFLHPSATLKLASVQLKDYFQPTQESCPNPERYTEMLQRMLLHFFNRRLFTAEGGLVGSATERTMLGDRIAVILGCKMPVVLRPMGDSYQFIGTCFAEGLMDGEALQDGHVETEEISLC
ncbi:AAA-domain-containing protein [Hyaloscypha bicolor E]|uniref:AAA-domain-containing protein n=1 Tax=Hyaloscypha bicolor E TaxID=1095630 RepID=A0A2J6TN27_9HELO|nr:AAA-domain-containing protein [Hyaloscypha bicolor E]PMD64423.1 AAA-domain-containing protein [Hyaloscypha bicolor E]